MNITVKVNDKITVECTCFIEGDQWAVGAGEFGRMPYGFGGTIRQAVDHYIQLVLTEHPPKPITVPQPPDWAAIHHSLATIPPRQTIL